ncbi:MAG: SagB/ThcOx family dehydrogenase [Endomicrobia bacterium]|nr:SagB/ThcOx family dehydrogenase [Endomicrobiia bacterium]MCL2799813.1 SagB/ThcOx family dehydrogenase [Endomicrobiia bacterium]
MLKLSKMVICMSVLFAFSGLAFAQAFKELPPPDKTGGKPLMQALALRKTDRNISSKTLPAQELSNLLWATWGINRPDGKRTAPTGRDSQKIEVYAVLPDGVWLYDAPSNGLRQMLSSDETKRYAPAGVVLLYAVDASDPFSQMHVGSLYQNAGLYCASAGLANVVKAAGKDALKDKLHPHENYEVIMVHLIGYAK